MRFEVPQFIEVEDKIFGPFTWKQFVYLAGGGGLAVVLYLSLPFFFFILLGLPILALSGFLAFNKINNRPFSLFLESAIRYATTSRLYLWRKNEVQTIRNAEQYETAPTIQTHTPPQPQQSNIASLARTLELNALQEKK